MTIRIHIERLILEGLPLGHHEGPLVQAAVEAELARLMGAGAPPPSGGATARVKAPAISLTPNNSPTRLGQQIARSVHGGIEK
ncbi:MAG: hypothetical protein QOK37_3636 [Thermoanaerobaculia bacterium]|jgi:hypothetical protein|nr:hypothetical protein [Thermoanaerobaculia bacterium]